MKQSRLYTRVQAVFVVVDVPPVSSNLGMPDPNYYFQKELDQLTEDAWETITDSVTYITMKMENF